MVFIAVHHIAARVQTNGLYSEGTSQSNPLYHQCLSLLQKLYRLRGFTERFPDLSVSASEDPITHLWDAFTTGTPLCYIFDLLPADEGFIKISHYSLTEGPYKPYSDEAKKHAIAMFALQIRAKRVLEKIPKCETFTVADLWDRRSTGGLVKVLNSVDAILAYLPPEVFKGDDASPDPLIMDLNNVNNVLRNAIVQNMLKTEQQYVQDLENMQKYCNALSQANLMTQQISKLLFPDLSQLLSFQRSLFVRIQLISQLPFQAQRWGQLFLEAEEGFSVYESYCSNYINTPDFLLIYAQNLAPFNHVINIQSELPGFLFKPIQRVCHYPVVLDPLVKTFSPETHEHYHELIRGLEAARRIVERITKAQQLTENIKLVDNLRGRVHDWKGHRLETFGKLVLYDHTLVTRSDLDRPYHIFLFEQILILCKEYILNSDKTQQSFHKLYGSMPSEENATAIAMVQKNTPLLLKGRIYVGNIVSANWTQTRSPRFYPLNVDWMGDIGYDSFIMQCRHEQQRMKWQSALTRLTEIAASRHAEKLLNSYNIVRSPVPLPDRRYAVNYHDATSVLPSSYSSTTSNTLSPGFSKYIDHETGWRNRPLDYTYDRNNGDTRPELEDANSEGGDLEEYPSPSYPPSGRQTPLNERRLHRSRSLSTIKTPAFTVPNDTALLARTLRRSRSSTLPLSTPESVALSVTLSDTSLVRTSLEYTRHPFPVNQSRFSSQMPLRWPDDASTDEDAEPPSSIIKVKVHFQSQIFVMLVPKTIEFIELQDEIMRKIKFWDPIRAEHGPNPRVRYQDEDGDMISLASGEDLQIALSEYAGQVRLFVT